eukprot:gene6076-16301_t
MYNSITSMAGGIDPDVSSDATSALYACFAVSSLIAPALVNGVGPRPALAFGTIGYIAYVLSLLNYHHHRTGWLVVLAGALNGICAGLLWTAQGQLTMAYPTPELKGTYQAVLWAIFNAGR